MPRVSAGLVAVEVACPSCGVLETIGVHLAGVLTIPDDETPSLRIKAKSKPFEHDCGRIDVTLFTDTTAEAAHHD